ERQRVVPDARISDSAIKLAILGQATIDGPHVVGKRAHVARDRFDLSLVRGRECLESVGRTVENDEPCALLEESFDDGTTKTGRPTGNQNDLAFECWHGFSFLKDRTHVLGGDDGLVEEYVTLQKFETCTRTTQNVRTPADPRVNLRVQPRAIDMETRVDRDLVAFHAQY